MADLDFKLVIDTVTGSVDAAGKKLDKFFGGIQNNAKKMESVGKKLSIALTAPITAFAGFSIAAFKDQEKNILKFTETFEKQGAKLGFTFDELTTKAEGFSKNSLFQDDDILGGVTSQLLNFNIATKDIFDDAQQVIIDFAAKTESDLGAATEAIAKALQNPAEGLSLLRRQGLAVSDSQVELITNLDKAGKSAEAQTEIIKILKGQYAGFAAAIANTDSGKLTQLNNTFIQLKENFGQAFLSVLRPFIEFLTDLISTFDKLNPSAKSVLATSALIVAVLPPLAVGIGTVTAALTLLQIPLLSIAGPAGLLVGIPVLLVAASQAFESFGNAMSNFALQINKDFLDFFNLIDKFTSAFSFIPAVAIARQGLSALTGVVQQNIKDLEASIDQFIQNQNKTTDPNKTVQIPIAKELSANQKDAIKKQKEATKKLLDEADADIAADRLKNAPTFLEGAFNLPDQEQVALKVNNDLSELKTTVQELNAEEAILSNSFSTFFEDMATGAKSAGDAIKDLGKNLVNSLFSNALQSSLNAGFAGLFGPPKANGGFVQTNADGGHIRGAGSGTSDSILSRLSNGEFVIKAASVKKFGVDFFSKLNAGLMPGFNVGGHVQNLQRNLSGVPRYASGGLVSSQSPVNVQVVNNSSQPVSARSQRVVDPSGTIIQIVLEDLKANGAISQQMQGVFGVRR